MGATLAQKILARASGRERVEPGEYVTARVDWAMVNYKMGEIAEILARTGIENVWDGSRIICVLDHWNPPDTINQAEMFKRGREAVKKYGVANFYGQRTGIAHQIMFEKGHVFPGELVVGSDSHTVTYGAVGAAATGIGQTEMHRLQPMQFSCLTCTRLFCQVRASYQQERRQSLQFLHNS